MADHKKSDSHRPASGGAPKEDAKPPLPMHHRLKLGQTDGTSDPYGDGQPSSKATTARGGHKGH